MKIEVIDKDGWRKAFSCEKTLFHIGSAAMNDLVLDARRGAGVSARHAQLIALPDGAGYRLVNLGDANILLGENSEKATPVPPHSVGIIANGSVVKIGDYTLIFQGEAVISSSAPLLAGERSSHSLHSGRSSHIGLRLSLPYTTLAPHQTLVGKLLIGNHGDRAGVQFDLELEGIESECYRIEPAPLLSSGAESEVAIRFYHRGGKPLAGEHTIVIRTVAPQAYPGEEATVTLTLHIEPFFKHTLRPAPLATPVRARETAIPQDLLPPSIPIQRGAPAQRPQPAQFSTPPPPVAIKPAPRTSTPPPEDWWSIPEKATAAAPVAPPPAVVQAPEAITAAPEEMVITPPVAEPAAVPEVKPASEAILPPHSVIEVEAAAPAPPPVVEPETSAAFDAADSDTSEAATPEPEVAAPTMEAPLPVAESPPTVEAVAETSAQAADDWWGVSEPPSTEKPDVLVLKAAPVTPPEPLAATETAPEDETDAEQKPVSADDDWWSET